MLKSPIVSWWPKELCLLPSMVCSMIVNATVDVQTEKFLKKIRCWKGKVYLVFGFYLRCRTKEKSLFCITMPSSYCKNLLHADSIFTKICFRHQSVVWKSLTNKTLFVFNLPHSILTWLPNRREMYQRRETYRRCLRTHLLRKFFKKGT